MFKSSISESLLEPQKEEVEKQLRKSSTAPLNETDRANSGSSGVQSCVSEPLGPTAARGLRLRKAVGSVIFSNYFRGNLKDESNGSNGHNHEHPEEVSLTPLRRSSYAAAEIAFDGGTSPYCLISHTSEPEDLFDWVILPEWNLRTPNLILSIMGGAGNMIPSDKFDIVCFSKGLVEAATRTCAWVITGGTASGVMDIVGKAMQKHDKQRQVPCIGISPYGALTSKWRSLLEKQLQDSVKQTKVDAAGAVAGTEMEGKITLATLQDNHSHFIICDNGQVGSKTFGSEIPFRTRFEDYVAKGSMPGAMKAPVPRVMILVNGGKISLISLVEAIRTGCPLVVCQGTGRIADVICSILDVIKDRPCREDSDSASDLSVGEDAEFTMLLKAAVEEFMPKETLTQADIDNTHEIVTSGKVEIYSVNDRLEDVILRAVLGNNRHIGSPLCSHAGVWQQLALAVQWGCKDYYDNLGRRLIQDKGGHEQGGPAEAIRLIFQELVAFGWRNSLRDRDDAGLRSRRQAKIPINVVKNVRENAGPLVEWLLQHFLKQMDQFEVSERTLGSMGKVHWNRLGFQESWKSLEGLLLWSIEQEAPSSLLEIIWSYMEDPVHAALAAASACRDTAEREHGYASYYDCLAKKELDDAADRFERLAVLVVEDLAQTGKGVEYLFQESMRWQVGGQGRTCFKLAHELGCKMFVSATFYRLAVDLYWTTPVPFHINKRQLNTRFLSWSALLGLLSPPFKVCGFSLWEFLSIPSSQAWTHGVSRSLFVGLYSYAVFYRLLTFGGISVVEGLLFFWGLGLGYVEIKQLESNGFQAHIHDFWNVLDALHITVLLGALLLGVAFADRNEELSELEHTLEITHAMNLLPCWIRVLQVLQLSEYFGTLLITIFGMAKDALKFFILVVIFCFGFSCAITPILFTSGLERDEQGLTWAFWTIVGNLDEKAMNKLGSLGGGTRFVAVFLLYTLALVCNVLLVNLLIAVMNSTYEKNQAVSQTQWAYNRVEAVVEFDHENILPPPLNLLEPFFNRSITTSDEDETNLHGHDRGLDVSVTRRDLKDAQQRAFQARNYEEDAAGETAQLRQLRAELAESRQRNQELEQRNKVLEAFLETNGAVGIPLGETPFAPPSPNVAATGVPIVRKTRRLTTTPLSSPVVLNTDKAEKA